MLESLESRDHAASVLQSLFDQLESQVPLDWDVDFDGDALRIESSKSDVFLIYYHTVMDQLWYSSTTSGAYHFHLVHNHWHSTRDNQDLLTVLLADLHKFIPTIELHHHA